MSRIVNVSDHSILSRRQVHPEPIVPPPTVVDAIGRRRIIRGRLGGR